MAQQIKSRERVAEHGEVFTAKREVDVISDCQAVINLGSDEYEDEPAEPTRKVPAKIYSPIVKVPIVITTAQTPTYRPANDPHLLFLMPVQPKSVVQVDTSGIKIVMCGCRNGAMDKGHFHDRICEGRAGT